MFSVFNKQDIKRHHKGRRLKEINLVKDNALIQKFVSGMNKRIKTDGNWRRFCVSFMTSISIPALTNLKSEKNTKQCH